MSLLDNSIEITDEFREELKSAVEAVKNSESKRVILIGARGGKSHLRALLEEVTDRQLIAEDECIGNRAQAIFVDDLAETRSRGKGARRQRKKDRGWRRG